MHPDVTRWMLETVAKMKADPRIDHVCVDFEADTPVTMVRNNYVVKAREAKCDFLLMVDSDQSPDKHRDDENFQPFWDVAFNAAYDHYENGPLVIGAPYCGPPPESPAYVFYFDNEVEGGDETMFRLSMYPRQIAAQMRGIQECAALPTGLILCDMRAFELIEPDPRSKREVLEDFKDGKLDIDTALRSMSDGWFYYEWKDGTASKKASTEDVAFSRDVALAGIAKLGYNPLRCAWDSWIGHHKPMNIGKPEPFGIEQIGNTFKRAVLGNYSLEDKRVMVDASPATLRMLGVA